MISQKVISIIYNIHFKRYRTYGLMTYGRFLLEMRHHEKKQRLIRRPVMFHICSFLGRDVSSRQPRIPPPTRSILFYAISLWFGYDYFNRVALMEGRQTSFSFRSEERRVGKECRTQW